MFLVGRDGHLRTLTGSEERASVLPKRVGNIEVKALAIATALDVGVSHSRWAVMDTAAHLISSVNGNDEAVAVRRALEKTTVRLVEIEERLEGKKLHPILRELLELEKKARAAVTS